MMFLSQFICLCLVAISYLGFVKAKIAIKEMKKEKEEDFKA